MALWVLGNLLATFGTEAWARVRAMWCEREIKNHGISNRWQQINLFIRNQKRLIFIVI
jgi:hypothetical protein